MHTHLHHEGATFKSSDLIRDIVIGMSDGLTVPFRIGCRFKRRSIINRYHCDRWHCRDLLLGSIAMGLGGYLAGKNGAGSLLIGGKREILRSGSFA